MLSKTADFYFIQWKIYFVLTTKQFLWYIIKYNSLSNHIKLILYQDDEIIEFISSTLHCITLTETKPHFIPIQINLDLTS